VTDIIYLVVTVVFFGLMVAYLYGCERLGGKAEEEKRS
jgi:hypothetical protein